MTDKDLKEQLAGLFSGFDIAHEDDDQTPDDGQIDFSGKGREAKQRTRQAENTGQQDRERIVEPLHLFEPGQSGLTDVEHLYQASAELNTAQSYDDILTVLRRHTVIGRNAHHINLNYFDRPWTNDQAPEWVIVLARWSRIASVSFSSRYMLRNYPSFKDVLGSDAPTLIEDLSSDPRLGEALRALYQSLEAKSILMAPLLVSGKWVGFLNVVYTQPTPFPEAEVRLLMSLIGQAAAAVQNLYNLALAEQRVEQERLVRAIADRIRQGTDMQTVLRLTVQELSQMLGASKAIIRLGTQSQLLMQHAWTNKQDEM